MKRIICILLALSSFCVFVSCDEKCQHKGEWIVATEVTCTTSDIEILNCELCGEQQTKMLPANGHTWIEASCNDAKQCTLCQIVDGEALGHNYTSTIVEDATCTKDGIENYLCSRCSDSYESIINKKGHTNILQASGEDKCSVCNTETYSTYSIKALSALYKRLLSPQSATVKSVYANNYKWDGKKSIIVVINVTAQATAGGLSNKDYVILFDLETKRMTFDLLESVQSKIDNCEAWMSIASDSEKLKLYDEKIVYLNQKTEVLKLIQWRAGKLKSQSIELINDEAKKLSGVFG